MVSRVKSVNRGESKRLNGGNKEGKSKVENFIR